ncbi:Putative ribonuclease H protein At1g65750, partial [Linum perenne]
VVEGGTRWKIGNGRSINVWTEPWLRDDVSFRISTPMIRGLEYLTVADLMIPGVLEWDEENIQDLFNERDATIILSTPLPNHWRDDKPIWHYGRSGTYTVRSAYRLYMEKIITRMHLVVDGAWTAIWSLKLPPKVKHFIWRLGRGVVPTKEAMHSRGINVGNECGCCGVDWETSWHLFLVCFVARSCWISAGRWDRVEALMQGKTSFAEWLLDFITSQPSDMVQDVLSILWGIWEERNSRVWSRKEATPEWTVWMGREVLKDWLAVQEPSRRSDSVGGAAECKLWHPPASDSFKCNTDGAVDARGNRSGAGMVIRGAYGHLIKFRMTSWGGVWRSKEVEARALLEALSWVEMEGLPTVNFETDAQVVVLALGSRADDDSEFGDLIRSCKAILARMSDFTVTFCRRDRNRVAHVLARRSTSLFETVCGSDSRDWLDTALAELCLIDHRS